MVISKKPSQKNNEHLLDNIINKGGSSAVERKDQDTNDNIKITIRLPSKMLDIVDTYLEKSINKKARNHWIKEAIEEKIEKDIVKSML